MPKSPPKQRPAKKPKREPAEKKPRAATSQVPLASDRAGVVHRLWLAADARVK